MHATMPTVLAFAGIVPRIHPFAWVAPTATISGNVVPHAATRLSTRGRRE